MSEWRWSIIKIKVTIIHIKMVLYIVFFSSIKWSKLYNHLCSFFVWNIFFVFIDDFFLLHIVPKFEKLDCTPLWKIMKSRKQNENDDKKENTKKSQNNLKINLKSEEIRSWIKNLSLPQSCVKITSKRRLQSCAVCVLLLLLLVCFFSSSGSQIWRDYIVIIAFECRCVADL